MIFNINPDENVRHKLCGFLSMHPSGVVFVPDFLSQGILANSGLQHTFFTYEKVHEALPLLTRNCPKNLGLSPMQDVLFKIAEFAGAEHINIKELYQDICFFYQNILEKWALAQFGRAGSLLSKIIAEIEKNGVVVEGKPQQQAIRCLEETPLLLPIYLIMPQFSGQIYEKLIDIAASDDRHKVITIGYSESACYSSLFRRFRDTMMQQNCLSNSSENPHISRLSAVQSQQLPEDIESNFAKVEKVFDQGDAWTELLHDRPQWQVLQADSTISEARQIAALARVKQKVVVVVNDEKLAYQIELALLQNDLKIVNLVSKTLDRASEAFLRVAHYLSQGKREDIEDFWDIAEISEPQSVMQLHRDFHATEDFSEFLNINKALYQKIYGEFFHLNCPQTHCVSRNSYLQLLILILAERAPMLSCVSQPQEILIMPANLALLCDFDTIFIAGLTTEQFTIKNSFLEKRDSAIHCREAYHLACAMRGKTVFLSCNIAENTPLYWLEIIQTILRENSVTRPPAAIHVQKNVAPSIVIPHILLPKKIAVTALEQLIRDPYLYYVNHILKLRSLPDPEADIEKNFGIILHDILSQIAIKETLVSQEDYLQLFMKIFTDLMAQKEIVSPIAAHIWPERMQHIANWMFLYEKELMLKKKCTFTEVHYSLDLERYLGIPGLKLTARVDRINVLRDGQVEIIDYKSGTCPTDADIASGLSPQLLLEALIVQKGVSELQLGVVPENINLYYILLTGRKETGTIKKVSFDLEEIEQNLQHVIQEFWKDNVRFFVSGTYDKHHLSQEYKHFLRVKE